MQSTQLFLKRVLQGRYADKSKLIPRVCFLPNAEPRCSGMCPRHWTFRNLLEAAKQLKEKRGQVNHVDAQSWTARDNIFGCINHITHRVGRPPCRFWCFPPPCGRSIPADRRQTHNAENKQCICVLPLSCSLPIIQKALLFDPAHAFHSPDFPRFSENCGDSFSPCPLSVLSKIVEPAWRIGKDL